MGVEHALLPEQGVVGAGRPDHRRGQPHLHLRRAGRVLHGRGLHRRGRGHGDGQGVVQGARDRPDQAWTARSPPGVTGKDVILHIIGMIGVDGALYKAMEFVGGAIEGLSMDERLTICNMAIEAGAQGGPDPRRRRRPRVSWTAASSAPTRCTHSDPDAVYAQVIDIDAADIEPTVAFPHLPSNTRPVERGARRDASTRRSSAAAPTGGIERHAPGRRGPARGARWRRACAASSSPPRSRCTASASRRA